MANSKTSQAHVSDLKAPLVPPIKKLPHHVKRKIRLLAFPSTGAKLKSVVIIRIHNTDHQVPSNCTDLSRVCSDLSFTFKDLVFT